MNRLAIYPFSLKQVIKNKDHIFKVIVGNGKFSTRIPQSFDTKEIEQIIQLDINVEVVVNNLFHEFDLPDLKKYLLELNSIGVSNIRIADFGIIELANELNLNFNFSYDPETLVVSYAQFDFLLRNNINVVKVAPELYESELLEIAKNKGKMKIEYNICGHTYMMQSKRGLISNYKDHFEYNFDTKLPLSIKEESRSMNCYVFEDACGTTNMYTGYIHCGYKKYSTFTQFDTLIINPILQNELWLDKAIIIFNDLEKKLITGSVAYEKIMAISEKTPVGEGYLNPKENIYGR